MPTLLQIDSSPQYATSVSRELTAAFAAHWRSAHPDGIVQTLDLNALSIPPLDETWIVASRTPEEARTPEQKQALALSDSLLEQFFVADEYVIGVPMHNFSIPGALKLWLDQIVRAGKTFSYADGTPKGLIVGKKATFILATGGQYDPGTQMASFNFVEPYLRSVFAFQGLTNTTFVTAGGAMALAYGADRAAFLAPHLQTVRTHAAAL